MSTDASIEFLATQSGLVWAYRLDRQGGAVPVAAPELLPVLQHHQQAQIRIPLIQMLNLLKQTLRNNRLIPMFFLHFNDEVSFGILQNNASILIQAFKQMCGG